MRRDVAAVRKAREALGDKAPTFDRGYGAEGGGRGDRDLGRGRGRGGVTPGKRRRPGNGPDGDSDGSETDESVRTIPMPRDTPPPIPSQYLRRVNHANANLEPLGQGRGGGEREPHVLPSRPEPVAQAHAQTVYEAKPAVRDLRKEAVSAFVPAVVQRKLGARKGRGKLLEPEEMDRLEMQGYGDGDRGQVREDGKRADIVVNAAPVVAQGGQADGAGMLEEEEERFERELRSVQMEEVEDEDEDL